MLIKLNYSFLEWKKYDFLEQNYIKIKEKTPKKEGYN